MIVFLALDKGDAVILVLDMIDHNILISRLEHTVGLKDIVLKWFKCFVSDRYFSVNYGNSTSTKNDFCGVYHKGLFYLLHFFSLYLLQLGSIFRKHMEYHSIISLKLYLPRHPTESLDSLLACLNDFKNWMKICLMLNEDKTEVIVFGQSNDFAKVLLDSSPLAP